MKKNPTFENILCIESVLKTAWTNQDNTARDWAQTAFYAAIAELTPAEFKAYGEYRTAK